MNAPETNARHRPPQPLEVATHPDALLTIGTVCALTGLGKSTLRRLVKEGKFPTPWKGNPRLVRWKSQHVRTYISELNTEPAPFDVRLPETVDSTPADSPSPSNEGATHGV